MCDCLQAKHPKDLRQGHYTTGELLAGLWVPLDKVAASIRAQAKGATFDNYKELRELVEAWDRAGFGVNAELQE